MARKPPIKTVKTLVRALDEGDESIEDFCRNDFSFENVNRIQSLVIEGIRRGLVDLMSGPKIQDPLQITYRLTKEGRIKVAQDEMASRNGALDEVTGISRAATQVIALAMRTQPSSIFSFATVVSRQR